MGVGIGLKSLWFYFILFHSIISSYFGNAGGLNPGPCRCSISTLPHSCVSNPLRFYLYAFGEIKHLKAPTKPYSYRLCENTPGKAEYDEPCESAKLKFKMWHAVLMCISLIINKLSIPFWAYWPSCLCSLCHHSVFFVVLLKLCDSAPLIYNSSSLCLGDILTIFSLIAVFVMEWAVEFSCS